MPASRHPESSPPKYTASLPTAPTRRVIVPPALGPIPIWAKTLFGCLVPLKTRLLAVLGVGTAFKPVGSSSQWRLAPRAEMRLGASNSQYEGIVGNLP